MLSKETSGVPAKAQTASGTRDFTGTLPIVLVMAFPSKARSVLRKRKWPTYGSVQAACP